jgi:hypothetical protein
MFIVFLILINFVCFLYPELPHNLEIHKILGKAPWGLLKCMILFFLVA